eukprot:224219-Pleurochrysis_carterae.AAC.2
MRLLALRNLRLWRVGKEGMLHAGNSTQTRGGDATCYMEDATRNSTTTDTATPSNNLLYCAK